MPIQFIPNDPEAKRAPMAQRITPSGARAKGKTDFNFGALPALREWPAASDEFLVLQCREALLRALSAWEGIAGPLSKWQGAKSRRKLKVHVDEGEDTNAYYDRRSLGFYHQVSSKTGRLRRFAASVDVVAHEAGHAFLDAIRPSLWDSNYPEPNAFHEAFGDCIAIVTALSQPDLRKALLKRDPKLSRANFVETLMESLANGIRDEERQHNGAKPRRGSNRHQWTLPTTLPDEGGPGKLINQSHSFGQVFVGCFYDTLRNVFVASKKKNSKALANAAQVVGRLLVRAADKASHGPRFFQAVGRTMTLEDETLHARKYHEAIRLAFKAHGILLGSAAAVSPRTALKGAAPKLVRRARGRTLAKATLDDLKSRMSLPAGTPMSVRSYELGGKAIAEVCHLRAVPLGALSKQLAGVVAYGVEPALIGGTNRRAAVLGALPDAQMTEDEVHTFVAGLLRRGAIKFDGKGAAAKRRGRHGAVAGRTRVETHGVVRQGGKLVLKRLRYACGCCGTAAEGDCNG